MAKKLDKVDLKILSELSKDAQMPYTEVAKKAGVSSGTVHLRMKKMMDAGMVTGTTLSMDYAKMGWTVSAFVGIHLDETSKFDAVFEKLELIPEVVKIHYTTGKFNMFIKVHARDNMHLKTILHDQVETISHIKRTETFLTLHEMLNRHILFDESTI
ncbi:Lrp/AsnC family transcriptional regulator [Fulvivirga sedimenti]|uniref:Lrp/AsnC ligand binding domain-containing protein n=1 Tax=Fulvivirga sedimenti TaxID=2879465 RepID=A0A9X1HUW8_9BACT|nr:Lrp/AsnC ligand binding domain-containing protein [Fulvivirga sedimenti]MCA6075495.1 Lrp/AsnC ligand binding domain-containing protein [Fulvivirga sedimenti]MCA6076672.1 Lrp/AsnC ligand binding domain-containing protein [Fulvivirga sedimenti]MCA6077800.1 Lrp/AsnC ligand binding domain-containing protein [Fulvivirga sedimenti]